VQSRVPPIAMVRKDLKVEAMAVQGDELLGHTEVGKLQS
jgi:hypothetical protein